MQILGDVSSVCFRKACSMNNNGRMRCILNERIPYLIL
uniref:Uncharacterized protein n=1 Tax=Arundo donax TaxID=35708 RepID=A0A0A9HHA7_ARUDO